MEKSQLLELVKAKISEKISRLENLIAETRASNSETKSSMGDKYETGREMLQQEINNLQIQLNEFRKAENSMKFLNTNPHKSVGNGSLVETGHGLFYIAVSLGELNFEGRRIFVVSPDSPIAKAMHGKSENQEFILNGKSSTIRKIW